MLEKATVLTTLFTIVDDVMKGSAVIQQALKRPGPVPQLTDSEVISIALYQELIGEPREDHFSDCITPVCKRSSPDSMNAVATIGESGTCGR